MPSEQYTDMQVALQARRRLELPLLGLMWLGMLISTLVDRNWFYLAAGTFAVGANLWAVLRHREVYAHRFLVKAGITLSVLVMGVELSSRLVPPVQAAAHGLILIQICKLFDRKTNRDYVQMLVLSGMTVVPATVFCTSPWPAALILAYLVGLIHVAMVLTVKRGLEGSLSVQLPGEKPATNPQQALWNSMRAWPQRPMRRLLPILAAVFIGCGALLFLIAPRESTGMTLDALLSGTSKVQDDAVRPQVVLGQARVIQQSDQMVMRVQTSRHNPSLRYLRGAIYDSYHQSRWFSRGGGGNYYPPITFSEELRHQAAPVRVWMDRSLLPWLFTPYPTLWISLDGQIQRGDRELNYLHQDQTLGDRPVQYQAFVWPQPLAPPQQEVLANLRLLHDEHRPVPPPEVDVPPRVEALARQWCSDLLEQRSFGEGPSDRLDLAIAHRLAQRLGKHCSYTLDLTGADPDLEPLEDFLFKSRQGNCEYFAAALTVMCHSLGVRARLASGYLMSEYNPVSREYLVRKRDAHAWTEVFTEDGDWQVIDATPLANAATEQRNLPHRLRQYLQAVQSFWYDKVLGYNGNLRQRLWGQIRNWALVLWVAGRLRVVDVGQRLWQVLVSGEPELVLARLSGLLGVLAFAVFGLILWRSNARWRRRRALARGRCWAALLGVCELVDRLAGPPDRGQDHLTLRERAALGCRASSVDPQAVSELIELYYQSRWGDRWPDDPTVRRARRLVSQLAQQAGMRLGRGV